MEINKTRVIYVDIDETICETPEPRNYYNAKPIKENIDKIFPGINEIDKNLIITALSSVPTLFDYFISITTGKYNNYMKKFMNNIFSFPQN